jgi:hypothetical protein
MLRQDLDPERRRRLMADGQAAVNRGEFYEAHEFWEEVWLELDDPEHTWVQGLIQVATGLHKLHQGHAGPAITLLRKAIAKLDDAPDVIDGVDAAGARTIARTMLAGLEKGELPDPTGVKLGG